ncbi:hypothetical protein CDCA_CDCA14G3791 [Cyanidium caldarium]|uniref:Chorein N-terminal domain-containing protein n=1 Tax=Cyanidium caldarium TaxID=2771 RepID=A0AAV9J049_CYACA|nr:hypothetical protein CDCA_CDCA14G3791 [Cyanidium caldarium]
MAQFLQRSLESLLTYCTSRYVSSSLQDVRFGIRGGHLVLDQVELRPEALQQLTDSRLFGSVAGTAVDECPDGRAPSVPRFAFVEGRARRLRIDVPWSALYSKPVHVYLEELMLLAEPHSAALQAVPAVSSPPPTLDDYINQALEQEEGARDSRWSSSLLACVLTNLHLEVQGISIEWRTAKLAVPFRCALSASSVQARSCHADGSPGVVSLDVQPGEVLTLHKRIEVHGMCVKSIPHGGDALPLSSLAQWPEMQPVLDGFGMSILYTLRSDALGAADHQYDVELDHALLRGSGRQIHWLAQWFFGSLLDALHADQLDASEREGDGRGWPGVVAMPASADALEEAKDAEAHASEGNEDAEQSEAREAVRRARETGGAFYHVRLRSADPSVAAARDTLSEALVQEHHRADRMSRIIERLEEDEHDTEMEVARLRRELEHLRAQHARDQVCLLSLRQEMAEMERCFRDMCLAKDAIVRQLCAQVSEHDTASGDKSEAKRPSPVR